MYTGPWHALTISWWSPIPGGFWRSQEFGPIPDDEDIDIELEWEHPVECGDSCQRCGWHGCGIDFELDAMGHQEALGPIEAGKYRVRHVVEQHRGLDWSETTTRLEVERIGPAQL